MNAEETVEPTDDAKKRDLYGDVDMDPPWLPAGVRAGSLGDVYHAIAMHRAPWMLDPAPRTRAEIDGALGALRPGMAWAMADESPRGAPGRVLHCAICRAAGINPAGNLAVAAVSARLGIDRRRYWAIVHTGGLSAVADIAQSLGYYAAALPGGRIVVGDREMVLSGS